jgi:hypothetical protein
VSKIINLCYLLFYILSVSLQLSQLIYYRDFYFRKSQKYYFNRFRLLRGNISSQFFINRVKCIDYDCYDINYKVRYYMPFKGTRRLAGGFKNLIFIFNRPTNRENILLGLLIKTFEKSKSRFLNTESREILIPFDNDQEFFS